VATDRAAQLQRLWAVAIGLAALWAVAPLAGFLILAVWLGCATQGWHARLTGALRGHAGIAAAAIVALSVALIVPAVFLIVSLALDLVALAENLASSKQVHSLIQELVARSGKRPEAGSLAHLALEQMGRVWSLGREVIGATAYGALGLLLLLIGFYAILVHRAAWYAWLEEHIPLLPPAAFRRYTEAFVETGHGMFYAVVLVGLFHAILAMIAYWILGLPDVLALGMLTLIFSVVPVIGTAAVWLPIAVGLAVTEQYGAALFLLVYSVVVVGVLEHFARPFIARRGHLTLPFYVMLIAMAGGAEVFGPWGILYGPLLARLAKEALIMPREAYVETRHL
jgi:predicted PurR-regulated permease PerM